MKIDAIHRGIVLDHIKAGRAMDIYRYLHLDELQCPVAIIKNARSEAMGLKDIIKIDDEIDIDLDVVGFVDPGTTVNIIKDGVVVEKKRLELPERLVNVIRCKNPRCITTVEPSLDQVFRLTDRNRRIYRCHAVHVVVDIGHRHILEQRYQLRRGALKVLHDLASNRHSLFLLR